MQMWEMAEPDEGGARGGGRAGVVAEGARLVGVGKVPDVDVESRGGGVCLGVRREEDAEAVGEGEGAVAPAVERGGAHGAARQHHLLAWRDVETCGEAERICLVRGRSRRIGIDEACLCRLWCTHCS